MRAMKDSGIEWIGEIPESWDTAKLLYLLRKPISDGPHETPEVLNEGIPFISVDSLNDTEDIDFSVVKKFISEEQYVEYQRKANLEEGDILFSKAATIGKTAIVKKEKFMVWSPLAIIKVDQKKLFDKFLYYLLNCSNLINDIILNGSYNTQINVGMRELESAKIPVLSLSEQEHIANYLDQKCGQIDALIEAKEKTNALLRERRQSIIYEAVTKGLNPDATMKDSGIEWIGEIPAHWGFSKLKYDAYMKGRIGWQGLKADEFIEEGPYLVTGTDFEDGKIQWERSYHISNERFDEAPEIHLQEQDLLITKDGTIGKLAYVDYLPGPASLNSHLLVIRPKNKRFINKYLYWVLSSDVFLQYTEYAQDGTIMASLSQEKISRFVFGLPSIAEQQAVVDYLDNRCKEMDALISANESTIQKLKEYRQSIIYEAVTGKIEV